MATTARSPAPAGKEPSNLVLRHSIIIHRDHNDGGEATGRFGTATAAPRASTAGHETTTPAATTKSSCDRKGRAAEDVGCISAAAGGDDGGVGVVAISSSSRSTSSLVTDANNNKNNNSKKRQKKPRKKPGKKLDKSAAIVTDEEGGNGDGDGDGGDDSSRHRRPDGCAANAVASAPLPSPVVGIVVRGSNDETGVVGGDARPMRAGTEPAAFARHSSMMPGSVSDDSSGATDVAADVALAPSVVKKKWKKIWKKKKRDAPATLLGSNGDRADHVAPSKISVSANKVEDDNVPPPTKSKKMRAKAKAKAKRLASSSTVAVAKSSFAIDHGKVLIPERQPSTPDAKLIRETESVRGGPQERTPKHSNTSEISKDQTAKGNDTEVRPIKREDDSSIDPELPPVPKARRKKPSKKRIKTMTPATTTAPSSSLTAAAPKNSADVVEKQYPPRTKTNRPCRLGGSCRHPSCPFKHPECRVALESPLDVVTSTTRSAKAPRIDLFEGEMLNDSTGGQLFKTGEDPTLVCTTVVADGMAQEQSGMVQVADLEESILTDRQAQSPNPTGTKLVSQEVDLALATKGPSSTEASPGHDDKHMSTIDMEQHPPNAKCLETENFTYIKSTLDPSVMPFVPGQRLPDSKDDAIDGGMYESQSPTSLSTEHQTPESTGMRQAKGIDVESPGSDALHETTHRSNGEANEESEFQEIQQTVRTQREEPDSSVLVLVADQLVAEQQNQEAEELLLERYKAERKEAKRERRRLEREAVRSAKAVSSAPEAEPPKCSPTNSSSTSTLDGTEVDDSVLLNPLSNDAHEVSAEKVGLCDLATNITKEGNQEAEVDEKPKRNLEDAKRASYWSNEIDKERVAVSKLQQLCLAEFCREHKELRGRETELRRNYNVLQMLIPLCGETYRKVAGPEWQVSVKGIGKKKQGLNDRTGFIEYWDDSKGKYMVSLDPKQGSARSRVLLPPGKLEGVANIDREPKNKKKANGSCSIFVEDLFEGKPLLLDLKWSEIVVLLDPTMTQTSIMNFIANIAKRNEEIERKRLEAIVQKHEVAKRKEKHEIAMQKNFREAERKEQQESIRCEVQDANDPIWRTLMLHRNILLRQCGEYLKLCRCSICNTRRSIELRLDLRTNGIPAIDAMSHEDYHYKFSSPLRRVYEDRFCSDGQDAKDFWKEVSGDMDHEAKIRADERDDPDLCCNDEFHSCPCRKCYNERIEFASGSMGHRLLFGLVTRDGNANNALLYDPDPMASIVRDCRHFVDVKNEDNCTANEDEDGLNRNEKDEEELLDVDRTNEDNVIYASENISNFFRSACRRVFASAGLENEGQAGNSSVANAHLIKRPRRESEASRIGPRMYRSTDVDNGYSN